MARDTLKAHRAIQRFHELQVLAILYQEVLETLQIKLHVLEIKLSPRSMEPRQQVVQAAGDEPWVGFGTSNCVRLACTS